MVKKLAVNIVIEREKVGKRDIFIASSPDINVLAEGRTIDEVKIKFLKGLKHHLETFPEERVVYQPKIHRTILSRKI